MGASVAVVGAGALGLVAVKNLLEEGYEVTAFDRNDYVGGLWQYTPEDKTSVLESTVVNLSKERSCFTDFPFPDDTSSHPTAAEVEQYLVDYSKHFGLEKHIRLNTKVLGVKRDHERNQWALDLEDGKEYFDKVILATGVNSLPKVPKIPGIELFEGQTLHSRAYKRPSDFAGKNVLVVGFSNTAADTATSLVGHAKSIHIAHRRGTLVLPRLVNGKASDHGLTYRLLNIQNLMTRYFPEKSEKLANQFAETMQNKSFKIRPEWGFSPAPSIKQTVPIISAELIEGLEAGDIRTVPALAKVTGKDTVELTDGTRLTVDVIIWATGYMPDYSLVEEEYDPTRQTTAAWSSTEGSNGRPLPRLFQNFISLKAPESLAFLGAVGFVGSAAFQAFDLATMALAQVWKGRSKLPSQEEMERAVDQQHEWMISLAKRGPVYPGSVQAGPWMAWVNEAAGTGVYENLGYGPTGWTFWLRDRAFCNLLMDGLFTPHLFRVFDGKRKKWDGAREAIEKVNEAIKGPTKPGSKG